jgi:hypothetical protein
MLFDLRKQTKQALLALLLKGNAAAAAAAACLLCQLPILIHGQMSTTV